MKQTIKQFTQDSLFNASSKLLYKLGIQYSSVLKNVTFDDYFEQNDFSYKYINEARKCIEHIWNIGFVDDSSFKQKEQSNEKSNQRYESMDIFACEIKSDCNFSRPIAVALTRAFNRVESKAVNNEFDMPVIVIMKQVTNKGTMLSIATCKRDKRKDGFGEKVGKVTILRNINCENLHPGHKQILERIANDVSGCSSYEELHEKWFKSFSIDILSDEFFNGYKAIYEDIIEYVTGKRMVKKSGKWVEQNNGNPCKEIMEEFADFDNPEKAVRDYVKNLMGRLVFIQFLQKKGWMGVPEGDRWIGGDPEFLQNLFENSDKKETFIDDVLEPLFNDLNTKRHGDLVTNQNIGIDIKVPYLNGGLFELDESDDTKFPLPARFMKRLLDFFASYNFTIDENAPDDAEIGVDPEMLGRIFENLLEDNKDKGAFYTPKEIVQYMCRESLIAYLQTDVNDERIKVAIRKFVTTYDASLLSEEMKKTVDQKLKDVKICDPAIGSGAFPMGMLRELYACRKAIEGIDDEIAVSIKTHIIQNNIYGVDIEKGAVDIARLRFWLALIVDEKNPHALPNMDFKIMQGNSLLEQYDGVELSGMSLDEQKKRNTKKGQAWQATLAFDEKDALDNIQHAIKEYYLTDDHNDKLSLRNIINENVRSYIINLKGCTDEVQRKIEKLPIPNDKFFLWHIYFKEVFDKGGFDIVIGNPPYIQLQKVINYKGLDDNGYEYEMKLGDLYKDKKFMTFSKEGDIYCLFYEQGVNLLCKRGHLCYITSNKWMKSEYGLQTRFFFSSKCNPKLLIDFTGTKVFENATVDVNILLLSKDNNAFNTKACAYPSSKKASDIDAVVNTNSVCIPYNNSDSWLLLTKGERSIKMKIEKQGTPLSDWDIKVNYGIKTGFTDAFVINTEKREEILSGCFTEAERLRTDAIIKPMLRGKDIGCYKYEWDDLWIICTFPARKYDIDIYPSLKRYLLSFGIERLEQTGNRYFIDGEEIKARKKASGKWFETQDNIKYYQELDRKKIAYREISTSMNACLLNENLYVNNKLYFITGEHLEYLIGILNSTLFNRMILVDANTTGGKGTDYLSKKRIPLYKDEYKEIAELATQIQEDKAHGLDTSTLEARIDHLVYDLYGLTEDEIRIVEGKND